MAFTFGLIEEDARAIGSGADSTQVELYVTATGPASYTTGGEAIVVARDFGLSAIKHFSAEVNAASATDVVNIIYDRTNTKLVALDEAGTEITSTTNLSARTFRFRVIGTRKTVSTL